MSLKEMVDNANPTIIVEFAFAMNANLRSKIDGMSNDDKQVFAMRFLSVVSRTAFWNEAGEGAIPELTLLLGEEAKKHPVVTKRASKVFVMMMEGGHKFQVWHAVSLSLNRHASDAKEPKDHWAGPIMEARCVDAKELERWASPFIQRVESQGIRSIKRQGVAIF